MDMTIKYLVKPIIKEKIKPKKINHEFYKERILDLTKHLLDYYDIQDNMMETEFNNYINACVDYFYRTDFNDAFQKEHKEKLETILEEPIEKEINIFTKMMPRKKINIPFPIQKIFDERDEELKEKRLNISN